VNKEETDRTLLGPIHVTAVYRIGVTTMLTYSYTVIGHLREILFFYIADVRDLVGK